MSKFILSVLTVAFLLLINMSQASALELLSYKDTSSNVTVVTKQAVESAWASNQPACLKEGAKLIGVNQAFKQARLGYRDCSNSAKRQRVHTAMGIKVTVFKLSELPTDMIKNIKKVN